jgi:hypothetical protein
MKTREKMKNIMKSLMLATLVSTMFVACGKNNESGGSSNTSVDPWSGGVTAAGNGSQLPSDWKQRIFNEYQCQTYSNTGTSSNSRVRVTAQSIGQLQVNAGGLHVGVTLEGDVLIISNSNNKVSVEVYACPRTSMQNTAQFIQTPIINQSMMCAIGEISAADMYLDTQYGPYHLAFFPIGLSSQSSLCQSNYNQNPYYQY